MISDSWQTPTDLFEVLDKGDEYMGMKFDGFHFDIDLCASKNNKKVNYYSSNYLNLDIEGISHSYIGKFGIKTAFLNPPYSNPKPFIEKAWSDSKHCKIVCLVKADTSTQWWATFWNYTETYDCPNCSAHPECVVLNKEDNGWWCAICKDDGNDRGKIIRERLGPKPGCEVRFFPKRIKFDPPQELIKSGEIWEVAKKWVQKCRECDGTGEWENCVINGCRPCKGRGYKEFSDPTFPSALVVMDRRGLR